MEITENVLRMLTSLGKRTATLFKVRRLAFLQRRKEREREFNHVKEKVVSKQTQFERESDKFAAQVVVV